ncbi:hypothetical protein [uncultured Methanospirillum sp.]|uniref:hypothetical protein n=1 Tax=uncultured Methanospirillum sp. TaxID=262503 RepID=UPI0029C732D3|nr:hypothetical protein [uncultured Methanospirillum sp.]
MIRWTKVIFVAFWVRNSGSGLDIRILWFGLVLIADSDTSLSWAQKKRSTGVICVQYFSLLKCYCNYHRLRGQS